ncbi:hypothetical protein WA026_014237 [Henosepilachna vigintioctopunctata]|uniref:Uncharacterized protein n=1 Tax=Henosepilachna vigintioctopunctata TaxID=420089 RepID=A0AAW1TKH9_9CUCU
MGKLFSLLYADDSTVAVSSSRLACVEVQYGEALSVASSWLAENGLCLNEDLNHLSMHKHVTDSKLRGDFDPYETRGRFDIRLSVYRLWRSHRGSGYLSHKPYNKISLVEQVNTSVADEGTESVHSSVHFSEADTKGEESNANAVSHTSTDLDEVKKCFEEIIENNKVMYFAQLFRRYKALLLEFGDCEIDFDDIKDYQVEMLQKKIEKIFGDRVTIEASTGPRHQKIIYKTDIDISIMANNTTLMESKEDHKFEDVSYDLRNCIRNIDYHPLPRRLTAEDIIRGEFEIPEE